MRPEQSYDLRIRWIAPHKSYSGLAATEHQIYMMLRPFSGHAHLIFSGTTKETLEFLGSLPPNLQNWY